MNNSQENIRDFLKGLSTHDFLRIGVNEIAYVRPFALTDARDGDEKQAFAVYAADGTQLSVLDTMDMAMATMRHNDLLPVTLH